MGAVAGRRGRCRSGSIRSPLAAQPSDRHRSCRESRARETGQPELGGAPINRALLYAAVRSIALDLIRRDSRRARREAEVVSESDQAIEPHFELADEAQIALVAAVDRLSHDQREVLVMKIWNELTFAEIATALDISQNTAASRYRYALAALKKTLQPL